MGSVPIQREILIYVTAAGRKPFIKWLSSLSTHNRVIVANRIDRVRYGNFGDSKSVGDGVYELRINIGPGLRLYYGIDGKDIVLILCAGNKSTQKRDIRKAKEYWNEYKENK